MSDFVSRLLTIAFGFFLGFFFHQYRQAQSDLALLISEHISDLENLKNRAEDYWLLPNDSRDKAANFAAKTRSAHFASLLFQEVAEDALAKRYPEYLKLSETLADQALGGSFDSNPNRFDPERAVDTVETITRIVHLLRLARRDAMSLQRLLSDVAESVPEKFRGFATTASGKVKKLWSCIWGR